MALKTYTDDDTNLKLVDLVQTTPRTLDALVKGSFSAHHGRHESGGADPMDLTTFTTYITATGWLAAGETWTFGASDAPTYTFTIVGDKTTKYSAGMKIKLTDSGTQYGIITKVAYGAPNTTITVYMGTDYSLSSGTITNPYYSVGKAPQGFPLDPDKWTVEVSDAAVREQTNPVKSTWYNPGTITINIPIGVWNVEYFAFIFGHFSSETHILVYATLSTANNTESDSEFTTSVENDSIKSTGAVLFKEKILNLSVKDTYYLNLKSEAATQVLTAIRFHGGTAPTIIRAICAYL